VFFYRLALQQAEKRYLTETDSQDKFDKQIRELEEKRQNLLQVKETWYRVKETY
jgi:hypothetical protein